MVIKANNEGHWGFFPYSSNYSEGRTNNGGIDLTKEPERIDEILELDGLDDLKALMLELNKPITPFMSTGFLYEYFEDVSLYHGQIEFTFKPEVKGFDLQYEVLDDLFIDYIATKFTQDYVAFYQTELIWEMHVGSVHGFPPNPVYTVFFRSRHNAETQMILAPLLNWLCEDFGFLVP